MSREREIAIRWLERSHALPRTLNLRAEWAVLNDAELDALLRTRYNFMDGVAIEASATVVNARLRDLVEAKDSPLMSIPLDQGLAMVDYYRTLYAADTDLLRTLDGWAGALYEHDRQRQQRSEKARASAKRPHGDAEAKAQPYIAIWRAILRDARFQADTKRGTVERQAREFERRIVTARLDPVSAATKAKYKRVAQAKPDT